ncbi:hypothetical protein GLAREA_12424 [Glarea lozoyensis ATCC 20868]|uniref:Uncharacterized protein n=1 Tax=Glarea lozoyensis (strain ATCC 20868 / MF5171) TaxID=1116229 RepID=S3DZB5_GLAL2|nr:uncharacterized protein GLAREA_12424 [Glarea lozoyensis ATCC 20868]EPE31668.1 hypothetical protein GLAREA_12424 [Glarea lozoyensis ATCC 20868]
MNQLVPSFFRNRNQLSVSRLGFSRPRHNHNALAHRNAYNYPTYEDYCDCDIVSGHHVCNSCALRLYQPDYHACACACPGCDYSDEDDYSAYGYQGGYVYDPRSDPRMMLGYPNRRSRSLTGGLNQFGLGGLGRLRNSFGSFPNFGSFGFPGRGGTYRGRGDRPYV